MSKIQFVIFVEQTRQALAFEVFARFQNIPFDTVHSAVGGYQCIFLVLCHWKNSVETKSIS